VNGTYIAVAARIRAEFEELARVVERTETIWAKADLSADDYAVDATALNLHAFYAGLERVFELIALRIDQTVPAGPRWHQELLLQMSAEMPDVRPAVLARNLVERLDRYRGFRHVVRNVYTYQLDPDQVALLVGSLPGVLDELRGQILAFADQLELIGRP
jgi:hypothetical protein